MYNILTIIKKVLMLLCIYIEIIEYIINKCNCKII